MRFLLTIPAILSALLLGAHLMRAGWLPLALFVALLPLLLLTGRSRWVLALEGVLVLGALEWLRTLFVLVGHRQAAGLPYLRLAAILGGVALLAALSTPLLERWRQGLRTAAA